MIDPIADFEALLARSEPPAGHFASAGLDDNGVVVIRDERGNPTAWMSEAAFDTLRLSGATEREREMAAQFVARFREQRAPAAPMNRKRRRAQLAQRRKAKP